MAAALDHHEVGPWHRLVHPVGGERRHVHVVAPGHHQRGELERRQRRREVQLRQVPAQMATLVMVVVDLGGLAHERVPVLRGVEDHREIRPEGGVDGGRIVGGPPPLERSVHVPLGEGLLEEENGVGEFGRRGVDQQQVGDPISVRCRVGDCQVATPRMP